MSIPCPAPHPRGHAEYQYVIVDTAPALDERSLTVMENSDTVFLLATLDIPRLKNLKITLETLA